MKTLDPTTTARLLETSKKAWRWVPLVALYRGIRAMDKRRWKIFLTTFFVTFWLGTALAQAADGGTGISSLIPLEDWSNGGAKTLVEDVPTSAYSVESTKGGITNPVIATMTGLASTVMLTVAEIGYIIVAIMSWLLGSAIAFEDTLDISPFLSAAATESLGWLFPSCLALGAIFTYFDYLREKAVLNGLLTLVITAVAAISLALFPNVWVSGLETARAAGNTVVTAISTSSGGSATAPFEYQDVSFSGNTDSQVFARQATDAVWRQMVVTPWCVAQFGSVETCKTYGKELLTKETAKDKKAFLEKNVLPDVGEDSAAGQIITGDAWSHKLGSTIIACLLVIIMGFLIASLVFSAVIAFFQALLLLLLGVFFLPLGMIPGVTRSWLITWAMMLGGAVMANIIAMLMLSVSIGVVTQISMSDMTWGRQFFVSLVVLLAAFGLKHTVATITGSASTSGGGFGRSLSRMVQAVTMRKMFNSAMSYRSARSNNSTMSNTNRTQGAEGRTNGLNRNMHRQDATTRQLTNHNRLHRPTTQSTPSNRTHRPNTPTINNPPMGMNKTGKNAGNFHQSAPASGVVRQGSYSPRTGYRETVSPSSNRAPSTAGAPSFAPSSSGTKPVRENYPASAASRPASSRGSMHQPAHETHPATSAASNGQRNHQPRALRPAPIQNGLRTTPPPSRRANPTAPRQMKPKAIKVRQAAMRARGTGN